MSSFSIYNKYVVYHITYSGEKLPQNYIGSTSLDKINNGYMGSVKSKKYKQLWRDELKNNKELFTVYIISYHDTRQEAIYKELQLQKLFNVVSSELFVNQSFACPSGSHGRDVAGELHPLYGKNHSEQTRRKISNNHIDVSGINNPRYGDRWKVITNGIENKNIGIDDLIPNGWSLGMTRSKETKPRKSRPKSMSIHNTQIEKRIYPPYIIPEGWQKGQLPKNKFICLIANHKEYDKLNAYKLFPELFY